MAPRLSILVAVYNAMPFLEECLASLVSQTLDPADYEILLIDDKSTDGSLALCEAYEKRHRNVRVFPLPETSPGLSAFPLNFGIKNARGRYIGVVDGDDYALPEMFRELLAAAEKDEADLAVCSFSMYSMRLLRMLPPADVEFWEQVMAPDFETLDEVGRKDRLLKLSPTSWRKLCKRSFLLGNGIFFPVDDFARADTYFHWASVLPASRIVRVDKRLLVYRTHRPGQSTGIDPGESGMQCVLRMRQVKELLLSRGLYADYYQTFLYLGADTLNRVPPGHPMRAAVEEAIVDLCSRP
ncbi:MAG: glycosyltransferase [Deltaproteobacteria bacterium]|nr:glycosyltransferase [Deltaproteobacteria bacterium]